MVRSARISYGLLRCAVALAAVAAGQHAHAAEPLRTVFRDPSLSSLPWISRSWDGSVAIDEEADHVRRPLSGRASEDDRPRQRWFGELDWIASVTPNFRTMASTPRPSLLGAPPPDELSLDSELTLVGIPSPLSLLGLFSGGRIRGEYLDDFDENTRAGGSLILDTVWSIGVDSEAYYWTEDDPAGGDRNLSSGDVNAVWRIGQGTPIRFHSGLGMNWLHERGGTEYGFNTTYALEIQVKSWLAFGGSLDWGRVGDEELFHGRITTSYMLGLLEIYAGYDIYEVGWIERDGLIAGVGLWF